MNNADDEITNGIASFFSFAYRPGRDEQPHLQHDVRRRDQHAGQRRHLEHQEERLARLGENQLATGNVLRQPRIDERLDTIDERERNDESGQQPPTACVMRLRNSSRCSRNVIRPSPVPRRDRRTAKSLPASPGGSVVVSVLAGKGNSSHGAYQCVRWLGAGCDSGLLRAAPGRLRRPRLRRHRLGRRHVSRLRGPVRRP